MKRKELHANEPELLHQYDRNSWIGPVKGEIVESAQGRQLLLQTPSDNAVEATQAPDRRFVGTFSYSKGTNKEVRIVRISDTEAQQKIRAAQAAIACSGEHKKRARVFLCLSSGCWLSYNASLHAHQTVEHPLGTIKQQILRNARLLLRGLEFASTSQKNCPAKAGQFTERQPSDLFTA